MSRGVLNGKVGNNVDGTTASIIVALGKTYCACRHQERS
jgi:hypothetical protein